MNFKVLNEIPPKKIFFANQISQSLETTIIIDAKKAFGLLGQEFDAVIFDMHDVFNPNAFGAIAGTIRVGGFLILIKPDDFTRDSLFLERFNRILAASPNVHLINKDNNNELNLPKPHQNKITNKYATKDQEIAIKDIIKVVKGHRRRPLVITSDRGRGKSAALGIAAKELGQQNIDNIILCAPSKKSAAIVFKHAETDSNQHKSNLTFYSPDDLHQQKPKADLVLIDEAAAIPTPMLHDFLKHYSRLVFASTQYGYEGCGRGFGNENDSLEQFTFDALLLNADIDNLPKPIPKFTPTDCYLEQINKQALINENETLQRLFGLLVNAHYQTKPSDLMQMLDDESIAIYCLKHDETIIAVALLIKEGNIDSSLSNDIFAGKRRLKGHLVAQALSSNIGIESAIELTGERISRIAVHPQLQSKGFGTHLIQLLFDNQNCDYLSTSYAATEPLLRFWKNLGFKAVHLGIKRDASSGSHSVTMLKGKTQQGLELSNHAQRLFNNSFPHLLSDCFNELETELVFALLSSQENDLDKDDIKQISSFSNDSRGYENSHYLLWRLVVSKLADNQTLNIAERTILISKVLQKKAWNKVKQKMINDVSGKKEALALLRTAIGKLL